MMKRIGTIIARVLLVLYLAALAYLCFGKFSSIPSIPVPLFGIAPDKFFHFIMFLPFPFLVYFSIGKRSASPWKAVGKTVCIFLLGCLLAAATEVVQSFIIYRSGDAKDFLADGLSLSINSLIVFVIDLIRNRRLWSRNPSHQ